MENFDAIVIGAGSAGCVVTARLVARGLRVLLLEAGPDYRAATLPDELRTLSRPIDWPHDWRDKVTSYNERLLHYGRGRVSGGSSQTNGAVALRAEPPDFESWPAGWQWDDMLPWFCAIERDLDFGGAPHHGASGPIPIVRWRRDEWAGLQCAFYDACVDFGLPECADHNEPHTTGIGAIPMNRVGRDRFSNATAFLEPVRDHAGLVVRGESQVRRLVFRDRAVRGVELVDGTEFGAPQVFLCAGVVQDPLVLWRSGIGPSGALGALGIECVVDAPDVGANVTDHAVINYVTPIDPGCIPDDAPSIQTILRATSEGSPRVHDIQLTPFVRRHGDGRREIVVSVSLQLPDGAGSITPTTADPMAPARIHWPFGTLTSNRRRMHFGWRLAAQIVRRSAIVLDQAAIESDLALVADGFDRFFDEQHYAFDHGVGTCRMGDDDRAVVDPQCALRGVSGVWVIDASVAPTVPRANTHLLATALAARAMSQI